MLGYIIANTKCHWKVIIEDRVGNIMNNIDMFVCGCTSQQEKQIKATLDLTLEVVRPASVTAITKLCSVSVEVRHLQLKGIAFGGPGWLDISSFFDSARGQLPINHLTLDFFPLSPTAAERLKMYLAGISDIKHLSLKNILTSSQEMALISEGAKACSSLEKLDVCFDQQYLNYIGRVHFSGALQEKATLEALRDNPTLKTLELSSCYITSEGACLIAEALINNKTLETLNVSRNEIENAGVESFTDMLKVNKTLKELDISRNLIGTAGAVSLAGVLKINSTLKALKISRNPIGVDGAVAFADMLKVNKTSEELKISRKEVESINAFAAMLKVNKTLKILNIDYMYCLTNIDNIDPKNEPEIYRIRKTH
jgi:hypothetical protein